MGDYFSRFLPNRPRSLSSFDTHLRWQPVTRSARSRRSYGKIEDREQSSIKWASGAFLTASRLLCMSSSGIRMTSLIECPAWLKCRETRVGSLSCWCFKKDRRCSPNRSFSWRLVSPIYWHWHLLHWIKQIRFLDLQDKWSMIFVCSLVVVKI